MKQRNRGSVPYLMWAVVLLALGAAAVLLVFKDRRSEPPPAYRYDIDRFRQSDAHPVLFREGNAINIEMEHPASLALDASGVIYVGGQGEVLVLDAQAKETTRFAISENAQAMAVLPSGDLLIGMEKHCEHWKPTGTLVKIWESLGEKTFITSIVANESEVYIADAGRRCIVRCNFEGEVLNTFGQADKERGNHGLVVPSPYLDIAFDAQGAFWTVNPGRHGLENYRADGELISSWHRPAMTVEGFCGCCNPIHIAFRSNGTLVTAEKGIFRVKLYSPDQQFMGLVAGPESFGQTPETALSPDMEPPVKDLAVDKQDRIWVLDGAKKAIRLFEEKERTR